LSEGEPRGRDLHAQGRRRARGPGRGRAARRGEGHGEAGVVPHRRVQRPGAAPADAAAHGADGRAAAGEHETRRRLREDQDPGPARRAGRQEVNRRLTMTPSMLRAPLCALVLMSLAPPASAQEIVSHPDQLRFPSFTYMPPKASQYRVKLSNGMIAYLVPDRTTPLVSVHVLMRLGPQLDPAGKEGLAALCGNLLTRSGMAGMTAGQGEAKGASLGAPPASSG